MSNPVSHSSTPISSNFSIIEGQLPSLDARVDSTCQVAISSIQAAYTNEQLTNQLKTALLNKDHHQLQLLSTVMNRIDERVLERALCPAAINGHLNVVQYLLGKGTFSKSALESALKDACKIGHHEIYDILSTVIASDTGRVAMIQDSVRTGLILLLSSQGHVECLDRLLRLGPIERSLRDSAITNACRDVSYRYTGTEEIQRRRAAIIDMLRMVPTFIGNHAVRADSSNYPISLEMIKQSPLEMLTAFSSMEKLPNAFRLEESPNSVDLGGISKEVYFILVYYLIFKKILPLTKERLPFIENNQASHKELLTTLGKFFSLFVLRNAEREKPFCLGPLFSSDFYKLLKLKLENPEQFEKNAIQVLKDSGTVYTPCFEHLSGPTDDTLQKVKSLMNDIGIDELSPDEFAKEILNSYLLPIEAFLDGASSLLKDKIRATEPEELCLKIQGQPITKERLKNALSIEDSQPQAIQTGVEWIKELIDQKDDEWVKRFVFAITGMQVLFEGAKIKIKATWRGAFEFHTCFNSLDIPIVESKEDFLVMLESTLSGTSYNIA